MLLLVIAFLTAVGFFIWAAQAPSFQRDGPKIFGAIGVVVFGCLLIVAAVNQLAFPGTLAATAPLRESVELLGCHASHDVLGAATDFNRDMVSNKYWRHRWYTQAFVSPLADTVTPITIPNCKGQ